MDDVLNPHDAAKAAKVLNALRSIKQEQGERLTNLSADVAKELFLSLDDDSLTTEVLDEWRCVVLLLEQFENLLKEV